MSKRNAHGKIDWWLTVIIGAVFGALVFFIFLAWKDSFQLAVNPEVDFDLDPVELLSLFVTIGLAVYVTRTLQRKDDDDKVERDLLMDYFKDFSSSFVESIHEMSNPDGVESADVASAFQRHGMALEELLDLANSLDSRNDENLLSLEKAVADLRELFSNIPREGEVEDGIRVEGTRLRYSPRHVGGITRATGRFRKAIYVLIAGINRS